MLVGFHSATLGRAWETDEEYIIGLPGDHSTLVKLPEHPPDSYHKVYNILEQFSLKAPLVIESRFLQAEPGAVEKKSIARKRPTSPHHDVLVPVQREPLRTLAQTGDVEGSKYTQPQLKQDD